MLARLLPARLIRRAFRRQLLLVCDMLRPNELGAVQEFHRVEEVAGSS